MPKVSFREGTDARKAASVVAEELKEKPRSGSKVDNPHSLARWIVKNRLSSDKRRELSSRR